VPTGPPLSTTSSTNRNSNRTPLQPQQEEFTLLNPSGHSTPAHQSTSPSPAPMSSAHQSAQPKSAHINPVENETPGETTEKNPITSAIESKAAIFTKAINKFIKSSTTSSKPKPGSLIHLIALTPRNSGPSSFSAS